MDPWVWAVMLLVMGLGLAILEVFFPSGGILGFLATCSILGAIVMGFTQGSVVGFAVLTASIVGLPVMVVLAFQYWPKTAVGRRVLLMSPRSDEVLPHDAETDRLKGLVGQTGETRCKMLPAGAIVVEGRTIDAVSEGMPIEEGQRVRIIEVRANRVVVRPVEDEEPSDTTDDPLRRPIDSVAPDPFEGER